MPRTLADALKNPPKDARLGCTVGRLIKEHKNGKDIAAAVDNMRWSAGALSRSLKDFEIHVTDNTIRRHRRQECGCFEKMS